MSASREKQTRQNQTSSGWIDPKTAREKEQRKQEKRSNLMYGTIGILFLLAVVASVLWRSNIIGKTVSAVTIDGEKYTAAEVGFYYQNAYQTFMNQNSYLTSYMGLDTSSSLKNQTINETAASMVDGEVGQSWHDYFLNLALDQMTTIQVGLAQAEAEGFAYPETVQLELDDAMNSLKTAATTSGLSVSQYLRSFMGPQMSKSIYSQQVMRMLQFEAYAEAFTDSLTYTDSEIDAAYKADTKVYDRVAYESVSISGTAESTTDDEGNTVAPTEEENAAALEAAKNTANKMLSSLRANKKLETLAEDVEGANFSHNDSAVYSEGDTVSEWLFDDARKAGDSAVLENGSTYYVVHFEKRFRETYNTIDVRHILVETESGTLSEDDEGYEEEQTQLAAAALTGAEELLAQWQSGEATEESFAALAMQESADSNKHDGGLYTEVYQGQMVETFNDWCFDASRKVGDTGVVETPYGAHVMYFSGENMPYWKSQVVSDLKDTAYTEWEDSFVAENVERHTFGMKFVG